MKISPDALASGLILRHGIFCEKDKNSVYERAESTKTMEKGDEILENYFLHVEPETARFYEKIAEKTGRTAETVMAETLFRLAGNVSLSALSEKRKKS